MSPNLQAWRSSGHFISYGPLEHQLFVKEIGLSNASADNTLLLLHGFPESAYSYHAVLDGLSERFDRIVLFDMIGYGFSDKPVENYSYSLLEQADTALKVWQELDVKGGHLLAHDMGTSVAAELLFRHQTDLLPAWFSAGFQSVTFTNGSLLMAYSKLRIAQRILLSSFGRQFGKLVNYPIFAHQIRSAHGNNDLSEQTIKDFWELNRLKDGHKKSWLTIKYIKDRYKFEHCRWLPALSKAKLPIHFCWGDADQVARVEMAHALKNDICPQAKLTIMKGLGHFGQLGKPEQWVTAVLKGY